MSFPEHPAVRVIDGTTPYVITEPGDYLIGVDGIRITIEVLADMSVAVSAVPASQPECHVHDSFMMGQDDAEFLAGEWEHSLSRDSEE